MKKSLSISLVLGFIALFFLTLALGPVYVRYLFENASYEILNWLTRASGQQSLDFYIGRAEEAFFGRLAQVFAGGALITLALTWLKDAPSRVFFWTVLGFLVITKWMVLFYPPYGDAVGGPFAEAWWLAQNNFNYPGLADQPAYHQGGPKTYLTTIFPGYIAILMKLIPNTTLFLFVNHLLFFAMAAGIVTMVRSVGRRVFAPEAAGLTAMVVLSWPVFQTQLEAINMELPTVFFTVLSAYYVIKGSVHKAGVAALLAAAVKGSGIQACAAFGLCGLVLLFQEKDPAKRKAWIGWGIGLGALSVLLLLVKFWMKDQHVVINYVAVGAGLPSLVSFPISYVFLLNLAVIAFLWFFKRSCVIGHTSYESTYDVKRTTYDSWRINAIMLTFATMWFLLFLNFMAVSPRYRVAVYPFLLFTVAWTFFTLVPKRIIQVLALSTAIVVVQFNSYGMMDAVMQKSDHVLLEENLQYRNDMELYRRLTKRLAEAYPGATLVAPFIVAQALAIPKYGYVSSDARLDVVIYGFRCLYGDIKQYAEVADSLELLKTVYSTVTVEEMSPGFMYPLNENDKVLEIVEWGNKKGWIFLGGFSLRMMRQLQLMKAQQKLQQGQL